MNTNNTADPVRGEVFYDADCGICSRGATRWSAMFERRGFHWLPLQTSGLTEQLHTTESEWRAEMKLMLANGRVASGVEAWAILLRAVWWLWPLGFLMGLPGVRNCCAIFYRWFARNRYRISGACGLPNRTGTPHRHKAFLELP